jgi:hypothetical protein
MQAAPEEAIAASRVIALKSLRVDIAVPSSCFQTDSLQKPI